MKRLVIVTLLLFSINLSGMESTQNKMNLSYLINNNYCIGILDAVNGERESFNEAVKLRNSQEAYQFLNEILDNDLHYPNDKAFNDHQKILMYFVLKFIESINMEILIYECKNNITEKELNLSYSKYLNLVNSLSLYKREHNIELDQINMSTCNGFDVCLITLAIKLCPSIQMLEFLIKEEITLNKADINGNTPLHILATLPEDNTTLAMAIYLRQNGMDISPDNNQRLNPRDLALKHKNKILAKILSPKLYLFHFCTSKCCQSKVEKPHSIRKLAIHNHIAKYRKLKK